ncbi:MAG: hypothetical protein HIU84_01715 [Acidobacteria bacterium]|nr:hypothetical protein [Acidobacteriota bacterium]
MGATMLWTRIDVTLVADALSDGTSTSVLTLSAATRAIPTRLIMFPD